MALTVGQVAKSTGVAPEPSASTGIRSTLATAACRCRGSGKRKTTETCDENVVAREIRNQVRISNLISTDLFACKWLRAADLNQRQVIIRPQGSASEA
jgi:hypothetical protein